MAELKLSPNDAPRWHYYIAASTVIVSVLIAIASFQSSTYTSLILLEKNNSILYQNQANKEWNHYLANYILNKNGEEFVKKAQDLEKKVEEADQKSQFHFKRSNNLTIAATLFEIFIALSSISLLIRRSLLWKFSLIIPVVGAYFLVAGLLS